MLIPEAIELAPTFEHLSIVDEDGSLDAELDPELEADELRRMYRTMVEARRFDELLLEWQRSGRIGEAAEAVLGLPTHFIEHDEEEGS